MPSAFTQTHAVTAFGVQVEHVAIMLRGRQTHGPVPEGDVAIGLDTKIAVAADNDHKPAIAKVAGVTSDLPAAD